MSDKTTIEWTDATFNPWWGCTKVSPGCDHCYAERDAARFSPTIKLWGEGSTRREFGDKHWQQPYAWNERARKAGKRIRVFCASMADVFDKDAPEGARERLWGVIDTTPFLDWQILTKRIGNVARMAPERWVMLGFPQRVWLGISVVDDEELRRDAVKLLTLPVSVRFLSCEPLLGPINVGPFLTRRHLIGFDSLPGIEWAIAGGESGPKARPSHPDWFRHIRNQCAAARVPFLFKQWGEYLPCGMTTDQPHDTNRSPPGGEVDGHRFVRIGKKAAGRLLDGVTHDEYPA